ncbi:MAG: phosphoribosylformylglycinamidine cyclo-ligase [Promethearchaeota archaeon Loki_b31]|nr:MAG: phosphoribosylformylglycinamidine cyclo-ligase [Candidatus Lokiarchaeota archaeon Loki_b31]
MSDEKDIYSQLGVSSKKEDVHKAIQSIDKGLFPGAFCKIVQDVGRRDDYCSIFHSDGAGTKASLAYMYFKETDKISVFRGIVRDALVMNVDDMLCVGATGNFFISNNIGRNKRFISGEVISTIIKEYFTYSEKLSEFGLNVVMCGGETADVGDIVKTLLVDASVFTSMKREDIINAENIKAGDVIVGLASDGRASYEDEFNSGIGSNGLTLARHGVLSHAYYKKFPECYDQNLDEQFIFFGNYQLTDKIKGLSLTVGEALLSPTRTYAPLLLDVLKKYREEIHGMIHNTGGGQTKILNFGKGITYLKNNLFKIPKIFEIIKTSSETLWKEMYQVFNMGHRMEICCDESIAKEIIEIAKKYNIKSKIIGQCEKSSYKNKNQLEIKSEFGSFNYD